MTTCAVSPLLNTCSGRSSSVAENPFEAFSQPKSDGVPTPADKTSSRSWDSSQVPSGKTFMGGLLIRGLMHGGLAGFRPFRDDYVYEYLWGEGRPLPPSFRSWRSSGCLKSLPSPPGRYLALLRPVAGAQGVRVPGPLHLTRRENSDFVFSFSVSLPPARWWSSVSFSSKTCLTL